MDSFLWPSWARGSPSITLYISINLWSPAIRGPICVKSWLNKYPGTTTSLFHVDHKLHLGHQDFKPRGLHQCRFKWTIWILNNLHWVRIKQFSKPLSNSVFQVLECTEEMWSELFPPTHIFQLCSYLKQTTGSEYSSWEIIIKSQSVSITHLWPYHPKCNSSHPISEAKQSRAWLGLGWEIAWEYQVPWAFRKVSASPKCQVRMSLLYLGKKYFKRG